MMIVEFLKAHERLLIVLVIAALIFVGYGKYADIVAAHDNAVLAQAKIVTAAQVQANAQLQAQVTQDATNLKALQDKLEQQNQQLINANTQLVVSLANRQKTDATLAPTELAARWNALVPAATPITGTSGLTVNPAGAVATVQALEQVAPLKQELANETTAKVNDDTVIASQTNSLTDLNKQVTGLNLLIVDNAKQCTDQIAVVKAEARKSKRRWFIFGFISGLVAGHYAGL